MAMMLCSLLVNACYFPVPFCCAEKKSAGGYNAAADGHAPLAFAGL
jgi:hypothetical protein